MMNYGEKRMTTYGEAVQSMKLCVETEWTPICSIAVIGLPDRDISDV